jgi:uncharacterized protein YyaL (SSP411 family)
VPRSDGYRASAPRPEDGTTRSRHAPLIARTLLALALGCGSPLAPATAATAAEAPGNRLAQETSAYLRQHADNPVDWYPWGEAAFAKALGENKLVFLSVGYATCYWCHVMEREVFEDEATAELLNALFVSVLVDREERPDLDRLYMPVRTLTTGETGWPLSVILTPDLAPLLGAGYLPKREFREILVHYARGWAVEEPRLRDHAASFLRVLEHAHSLPGTAASEGLPERALVARAAELYARDYDPFYGGFATAPKFPRPAILEMLMALYERGGHEPALDMVVGTLKGMARGGIHDQLGGGFHRYAVDPAWQVPHFEKMLYDNAQLLRAYARAHHLTGEDMFRRVALGIADYVARRMTAPSGLFHAAEDSESEGREGAFYLWRRDELQALLPARDFALFAAAYGVTGEAPLEGGHVLYRTDLDEDPPEASDGPGLEARLEQLRGKLLAARDERPRPFRDDKAIAAWNGLMIEALAYAGRVFADDDLMRRAARAARALLRSLVDGEGRLLRVPADGGARIGAYLEDYAAVSLGLAELYRATGNAVWRGEAAKLAEAMIERLRAEDGRGFHEVAADVAHLVARPRTLEDAALPAGNSLAVRALARLAALGLPRFAAPARAALSAFAPVLAAQPDQLPYMLWALEEVYRETAQADRPAAPGRTSDVVALAARLSAGDGKGPALVAELELAEGWHVNANPASLDFLIPTTLAARLRNGGPLPEPSYPSAKTLPTPLGPLAVYGHAAQIRSELPPGSGAEGAPRTLDLRLRAQACNDAGTCLPPETLAVTVYE